MQCIIRKSQNWGPQTTLPNRLNLELECDQVVKTEWATVRNRGSDVHKGSGRSSVYKLHRVHETAQDELGEELGIMTHANWGKLRR